MIGMIVIEHRPPRRPWWKRRPKPTTRAIAKAVSLLQCAEGAASHGERDGCVIHAHMAAAVRNQLRPIVPARMLRDPEWVHRHIEAPGARIQARVEDGLAES